MNNINGIIGKKIVFLEERNFERVEAIVLDSILTLEGHEFIYHGKSVYGFAAVTRYLCKTMTGQFFKVDPYRIREIYEQ